MTYAAKVLADSIANGVRLTTLEVTFPRFILAEFNTHRMLSRNSASSRAIPVERRIQQVRENPFVPEAFGRNKSGMQAAENVDGWREKIARWSWLGLSKVALVVAWILSKLGVHKQHANRVLELWSWHTVVVTATEWDNFFALRDHHAAQPEMQITARAMRAAMNASVPRELQPGEWHLPYLDSGEASRTMQINDIRGLLAASVARCAAVSFERQNAEKPRDAYIERHDQMAKMAHWSPFEHQARVLDASCHDDDLLTRSFIGNFRNPWLQYRKTLPNEAVFDGGS